MQLEAAAADGGGCVHSCFKIYIIMRVFMYGETVVQEQQRVASRSVPAEMVTASERVREDQS